MSKRVAVVTGSNKGVGFAIVRALCKKFDGDVILCSRDAGRGQTAVDELKKEGLAPQFHQLDINDHASIEVIRDFLKSTYGGLDVLVNNAGIAFKADATEPFGEQAVVTNKTNFFATLDVCRVLFPILKPHARVSNVSSFVSQWGLSKCSDARRERFVDPTIKMEELVSIMNEFVEAAQKGDHLDKGFMNSTYAMSKVGVTVMTVILQRELDEQKTEDIVVNACCPGYVDTDMTSGKGKLTPDQGAITPTHCALLPPNISSPRGKFLREEKVADWKM